MNLRRETEEQRAIAQHYRLRTACRAGSDGDCDWSECPQERNGGAERQPHCPLDVREED